MMHTIDNMSFLGSHSTLLSLYHFLWQQQNQSIVKRGLKCYAIDSEGSHGVYPLTFDAIDLSGCPGAELPNGATSMLIRSEYESLFEHISGIERNFVVHGSAGIGKSNSFQRHCCSIQLTILRKDTFLSISPRQTTSRSSTGDVSN
ncbi:hypothetical protein BDR06DRAFT_367466 [Suillus hirtellus]|nr:hypothetical protein BDR06DRAFT_367466 [Suillus hirtellus]